LGEQAVHWFLLAGATPEVVTSSLCLVVSPLIVQAVTAEAEFEKVVEAVQAVLERVVEVVEAVLKKVVEAVEAVLKKVVEAVQAVLERVVEVVEAVLKKVVEAVEAVLKKVVEAVQAAVFVEAVGSAVVVGTAEQVVQVIVYFAGAVV
jgi:uroporphyrinogen-III decarboxylase